MKVGMLTQQGFKRTSAIVNEPVRASMQAQAAIRAAWITVVGSGAHCEPGIAEADPIGVQCRLMSVEIIEQAQSLRAQSQGSTAIAV